MGGHGILPEGITSADRGFLLGEGTTTVGSGEGADLRLEGLESEHAMIVHDQFDEYVFVRVL